MSDPYTAGQAAFDAGKPFNERNSRMWKVGWRDAQSFKRDLATDPFDDDSWIHDPDMEARG